MLFRSIIFDGIDLLTCKRDVLRKKQGKEIGIIFQEPMTSLNPVKKIGWQVEESLVIHTDLSKKERKKRAIQVLRDVELQNPEEVYFMYPHQLSGGMLQRVMIAAAIINEPKLLIADEPTTALDVIIQSQLVLLLKKINKTKNMAILFISHDLSLIANLCTKILVMKNGQIIERGTVKEIFETPHHEYTKTLIESIPKWDI